MNYEPSQGPESAKIRFEIAPYVRGKGVEIGTGPWKLFHHAVGIDVRQTGILGSPNLIADAHDLGVLGSDAWDFVLASWVLHELEDPRKALREWMRLLKVGGRLILYTPHPDHNPPPRPTDWRHNFTQDELVTLMSEIGSWDLIQNEPRLLGPERSILQVYRKLEPDAGRRHSWTDPLPEKTAAILRPGGYGDSLWSSSPIAHLKEAGYHVTLYTEERGEEILRHDPNVDRIVVIDDDTVPADQIVAFAVWIRPKYDRFYSLVGTVETRLLPTPGDPAFYWPDTVRREEMSENYLETVHRFTETPIGDWRQRFHPSEEEIAWGLEERSKYPGPLVLIAPSGSSAPKFWPYSGILLRLLAERSIYGIVLGDLRNQIYEEPETYGKVVGMSWTIRQAATLATLADVVVGTESILANVVAFEDPLKIVILGHSSPENLTRDWTHTLNLTATGLDCWPCHRIHVSPHYCTREKSTGVAACHAVATPDRVVEIIQTFVDLVAGKGGGTWSLEELLAALAAKQDAQTRIEPQGTPQTAPTETPGRPALALVESPVSAPQDAPRPPAPAPVAPGPPPIGTGSGDQERFRRLLNPGFRRSPSDSSPPKGGNALWP